jgi:magnesium-transporting ATPase (P-type)
MASTPLRVLGFAFLEMTEDDWYEFIKSADESPSQMLEEALATGTLSLNFLCLVGLKDKLRKSVKSLVHFAS